MHFDRLLNKQRDWKGNKCNPSFGQNKGTQKKLAATYKQNIL